MHTHALVCLHTSRRAPCTRGTLQQVCTLSHSSKHTRTCVCGWAARTHLCLQQFHHPGPFRLSLPHWGWSGPFAMLKATSIGPSLSEEQPQRLCRVLRSHCVGQAMPPPAALQENLPWQAALAAPGQTSLPVLLEL